MIKHTDIFYSENYYDVVNNIKTYIVLLWKVNLILNRYQYLTYIKNLRILPLNDATLATVTITLKK